MECMTVTVAGAQGWGMSQGTGQSMAIATASRRKGRSPTSEGQSPDKCMAKQSAQLVLHCTRESRSARLHLVLKLNY